MNGSLTYSPLAKTAKGVSGGAVAPLNPALVEIAEPATAKPGRRTANPAKAAYAVASKSSLDQRNEMILEYLPLVKFIASRIASRLPNHIEVGDLVNSGIIGLIDAIEKFDASRKIKFKTYAEFRIKGAILDELRALDWVPRSTPRKPRGWRKPTPNWSSNSAGPPRTPK